VSEIRAVVTDFGGVLTTPLMQAFAAYHAQSGVPIEALGRAMARVSERDGANPLFELEVGRMSEQEFLGKIGDALREELGHDVEMHGFTDVYFANLHPNEEVIEHMRGLRDRGFRMAILTNNVREWEPLWRRMLPVDEIFELVVDSAFVGLRKPDPRIYELTLERLGLEGRDCLFVDDLEINCDAARELGMTPVWFRDTAQALTDIEAALASPT
jgi:epoxide hydrolase-like predicted phosphatase